LAQVALVVALGQAAQTQLSAQLRLLLLAVAVLTGHTAEALAAVQTTQALRALELLVKVMLAAMVF